MFVTEENQNTVARWGGVEIVVAALKQHIDSPNVVEWASYAIGYVRNELLLCSCCLNSVLLIFVLFSQAIVQ